MSQPSINPYGAVDLGALARPATPPPGSGPSGAAGAGSVVVEVTEETFEAEVIERSMTVPVVIDLWATWCGPCKQLSPVLERLAHADGGRWVLATIDVDANQRIAAAFGVQSIPSIVAVLKGQPVPLFQGALPEPEVRRYLDELLKVAEANGLTGRVSDPAAADEPPAPDPVEPELEEAFDAIERGDLDAAAGAYHRLLDRLPGDSEAAAGLSQVELMRRVQGLDPATTRAAADAAPDDVAAQCAASDVDLLSGDFDLAFRRLVDAVRRTSGDDRDKARAHLLSLFEVVGPDEPQVAKARSALMSALF